MKPRFEIGELAYSSLPEGPQGLVIDGRYVLSTRSWEYLVTFAAGEDSSWCQDVELSKTKVYK